MIRLLVVLILALVAGAAKAQTGTLFQPTQLTLGSTTLTLGTTTATVSGLTLAGTTTLSGFTENRVLYAGASGVLSQSTNLQWLNASSLLVAANPSSGATTYPMLLQNGFGAASTGVALSLDPTGNGPNSRDALIVATTNGANAITLEFKVANSATPATALSIAPDLTVSIPGIATDATHTDATMCVDTTTKAIYFGSGAAGICLGTSSLRFKHDVRSLPPQLDRLILLEPIIYRYNKGFGDDGARDLYGFAAEQVAEVMPGLVGRDTEGRANSVDWAGMVPVMVRAIQEQQREIDDLKRRVR